MIHRAKDLSPDQRTTVEGLLGRTVTEEECISIRATSSESVPEWLRRNWDSAEKEGRNTLSMEEIDAEIKAARETRRSHQ